MQRRGDICERRLETLSQKNSKLTKNKLKKKYLKQIASTGKNSVNYICLQCGINEAIPKEVVDEFDRMDEGDLFDAPRFTCENCGGEMYPEYYKSTHGVEYNLGSREHLTSIE